MKGFSGNRFRQAIWDNPILGRRVRDNDDIYHGQQERQQYCFLHEQWGHNYIGEEVKSDGLERF